MYDWDDVRIFLATARAKSLGEAALKLGIDAATVGRRLSRLETALGSTLFTRSPGGLKITAVGGRFLNAALDVEGAIERVNHASGPNFIRGTVRLSVAEGFGTAIVAPALPDLRRAHPQLTIELVAQSGFLSAATREADITVTLAATKSSRVVVEPLTDYGLGLFASPAYLKQRGAPDNVSDLRQHEIIGYIDDMLYAPELRYMDEILPDLRPTLTSSSIRAQQAIVANGGGIAVIPFFLAQGLVRILPNKVRLTRRFWISTHREALNTARTRAVSRWLRQQVKKNAEMLQRNGNIG